jgi:hypothetical protein
MPQRWIPDRRYFAELARPWKLATFAIAMALLLYGALNFGIGDWDVGVTLIMGTLTYATAPWVVDTLVRTVRERPRGWPIALPVAIAITWFVVDGAYLAWHGLVGNPVFREDNAHASTPIYLMAGFFWAYRGSLRELWLNLRRVTRREAHARDDP